MKKLALASTFVALSSLYPMAHAASSGIISFAGSITNSTCTVNASAAGTAATIIVPMGIVSINELGTGSGTNFGSSKPITLTINCPNITGLSSVSAQFTPNSSGTGTNNVDSRLLRTTGTAIGVGIGIIDSNNSLINLNELASSSPKALTAGAGTTGSATINLRAAYIRAVSGSGDPTPGTANGTLPFTLTFL